MEKTKVITSLAYKFIERFAVKGLGIIISIILARMLAPSDFGQVAILTVFIDISLVIVQGGLNTALVQNKHVTDIEYSTVFYLSLSVAIGLIIILFCSAPIIAGYYNDNGLVLPLRVYSVSLIFGAFNSVQIAKLQREMRFKELMICSLIVTVLSGITGIALAFLGYGIWALILYFLSSSVLNCIIMLVVCNWRPKAIFSKNRAKDLFSFGWKMLASAIICSLYSNIRSLIIGKVFSPSDLGFFNRGQQLPSVVSTTLDSSIQSVMLPVMSFEQDNLDKLSLVLRRSVTLGTYLVFPAMVGLAAVSTPLVTVLLTEKWLPCVVYMQIIAIAEMNVPISTSNLTVIKATGRSDIHLKLEVIRRSTMFIVLILSVVMFRSVLAITVGYLISAIIDVIIVAYPVKKIIGYGLVDELSDIWKTLVASIVMGLLVLYIGTIDINIYISLVFQITAGVLCYLLLSVVMHIEAFNYALSTFKGFIRK